MFLPELEGEADVLFRVAGLESDEPAPMLELATRVLGPGAVQTVHARALPGDACLAKVHGEVRIYLRRGLSLIRARWAIAHELAHHALRLDSSSLENEDYCNALAACLVAPRRAYREALKELDALDYTELAAWFGTTESCVALRFGEVTDVPLLLVAPARSRARGAAFEWAEDTRMRSPGIRRAALRDDIRRVALRIRDFA